MRRLSPLLFLACCAADAPGLGTASRPLLDPDTPWTAHTIYSGGLVGADGVDVADVNGDGWPDAVSPWETSGRVSATLGNGGGTVVLGQGLSLGPVEDAIWADVDDDGEMDIIVASENQKLRVLFAPASASWLTASAWTPVTIDAATGMNRWMRAAWAGGQIWAGGRVGTPAYVSRFSSSTPRVASSWAREDISTAGWVMELAPLDADGDGDLDVVVSDRTWVNVTPRDYSLMGDRWLEATSSGWVNHPIGAVLEDHKFSAVGELGHDVVSCRSVGSTNEIRLKAWTTSTVPTPSNFGLCQASAIGDLDQDGYQDIALTASEATGALSGVVMLRGPDWERYEISGEDGVKFDNLALVDWDLDGDLDVVTTEQTELSAVLYYENPAI